MIITSNKIRIYLKQLYSLKIYLNCTKIVFSQIVFLTFQGIISKNSLFLSQEREQTRKSKKSSHLSTSQRGSFILLKSMYESKQVAAILFMHKTPKGTIYIFYSFLDLFLFHNENKKVCNFY